MIKISLHRVMGFLLMRAETGLFWAVFGIMCVCIVALSFSTVAGVVLAVALTALWWMWFRNSRERFGETVRMCADGGDTCDPKEPQISEDGITPLALSELPLKRCELYLTDNIGECDRGMYEMHVLELRERRALLEESPVANAMELERLNKVLTDAARLPRRQCKLSLANWVRPHHTSFPMLKSMRNDYGPRGNPRHWAYCYAPMDRENSLDFLKQGLERNANNNDETVIRSGVKAELSNGVENERLEFSTLDPEMMRRTYCNFFYPSRDEKLMSFYQAFRTPEQKMFYAVDMTTEGIIRTIQLYRWFNGYLRLMPTWSSDINLTCQDDTTGIRDMKPNMPETPDRFNIEMAYYCSETPLMKRTRLYHELLRNLFVEVVSGSKLFLQLKDVSTVYVFNINICNRVDRIAPMEGNLMQMFGNSAPRSSLIHWSAGKTQLELCNDKSAKRSEICDVAAQMNTVYTRLQAIFEEQRKYGEDYRRFSQPGSDERIIMTPETIRLLPHFKALRTDQIAQERKFEELKRQKLNAVNEVRKLNMWLAQIETNVNNIIDMMIVRVKAKKIAIPEKPYKYISNDGRVYFQMT